MGVSFMGDLLLLPAQGEGDEIPERAEHAQGGEDAAGGALSRALRRRQRYRQQQKQALAHGRSFIPLPEAHPRGHEPQPHGGEQRRERGKTQRRERGKTQRIERDNGAAGSRLHGGTS